MPSGFLCPADSWRRLQEVTLDRRTGHLVPGIHGRQFTGRDTRGNDACCSVHQRFIAGYGPRWRANPDFPIAAASGAG